MSVAINGFEISGVTVPDGNGAAIRYEGGALSLSDDYFHDNQEGLLGAADPNGSITIDHSEFASNGDGSGSTHNIYVGAIASFTLTDSYIHDAVVGHEIKSRAASNTITGNRIFDNGGSASYSIDLPNGGNATISGNTIEQGPNTQNPFIVAYGEEGASNPGTAFAITGNTVVNDDPSGRFLLDPATQPTLSGNSVWGLSATGDTVLLASRPSLDTSAMTFATPGTVSDRPRPPQNRSHHQPSPPPLPPPPPPPSPWPGLTLYQYQNQYRVRLQYLLPVSDGRSTRVQLGTWGITYQLALLLIAPDSWRHTEPVMSTHGGYT